MALAPLACVVVALCVVQPVAAASSPPPPEYLVALVRQWAASLGDSNPSSVSYVVSHREPAVKTASGDEVYHSNPPVYLVVLTGAFTVEDATGPEGAKPPTGTVASITVDADTGKETDFGLTNHQVDLSKLGPVGDLMPYLAGQQTPACAGPDLEVSAGAQGATQTLLGGVSLTNRGTALCVLEEMIAQIRWDGRTLKTEQLAFPKRILRDDLPTTWNKPITSLASGAKSFVLLQWQNWCGKPQPALRTHLAGVHLVLRFAGMPGEVVTALPSLLPQCLDQAHPSTLAVGPYLPSG
jgi:hypothetical protein